MEDEMMLNSYLPEISYRSEAAAEPALRRFCFAASLRYVFAGDALRASEEKWLLTISFWLKLKNAWLKY
jgi:hypothetical protein